MFVGYVTLGDTMYVPHQCRVPGSGTPTASGTTPSYRVYDGASETAILTGNLAAFDASNVTGMYLASIAATAANGFATGKVYTVRVADLPDADVVSTPYTFGVV